MAEVPVHWSQLSLGPWPHETYKGVIRQICNQPPIALPQIFILLISREEVPVDNKRIQNTISSRAAYTVDCHFPGYDTLHCKVISCAHWSYHSYTHFKHTCYIWNIRKISSTSTEFTQLMACILKCICFVIQIKLFLY